MQLTSLLALLPLLAITSAAPACHRKERSDLAVNRGGWGQEGGSRWRGQGQQSDVAKPAPSASPVPRPQPDTQPAPVVKDTKDTFEVEPMPSTAPVPAPTNPPVEDSVAAPPPAPTTEAQPETRPVVEDADLVAPPPIPAPSPSPSPDVETPPTPSPIVEPPRTDPAPVSRSTGAIGLAMNGESKANVASFGGKVGWYYSWNPAPLPGTEGLEFVPMIHRAVFAKEFSGVIPDRTTHMLSFNEPDISGDHGGANMSPAEAAEMHKLWTGQVPASVKIGSPAVARGGQKWMDDWLAQCAGGCRYDFVPYHYYGTDANGLIQYTKDFYAHFQKPLWLTEFACHDYGTGRVCTKSEVSDFMTTFFTWADSAEGKGMLERWSWFGAFPNHAATNANGILNPDGTANEMGKLYASF